MTIKTLNVHFSFKLEPDEYGLHSVPTEIKEFIAQLRHDWPDVITVDPVTDAPGIPRVNVRKRGPNKPKTNGPDAHAAA